MKLLLSLGLIIFLFGGCEFGDTYEVVMDDLPETCVEIGQTKCEENNVLTCSGNGNWEITQYCTDGELCKKKVNVSMCNYLGAWVK